MPVTPTALETLSEDEALLLAEAQAAVDAELRQNYVPGKTVNIGSATLGLLTDANPRVLDALIESYSTDWEVIKYQDARSFEWLSFSAKI